LELEDIIMLKALASRIERSWYEDRWWNCWLLPFSLLFFLLSHARRVFLTKLKISAKNNSIPVVVIGNITVGGTGKTPLTCLLVSLLRKQGVQVGIISRGYGSAAPYYPYLLAKNEEAKTVGDEPKLLRDRLDCPVVIGSDRNAAIRLLSEQGVNLILSDDGLQHYKMARDYEIIVLDATRQLGNKWLLPAGPLREGSWRLESVDSVILNGTDEHVQGMSIVPSAWINAKTGERKDLDFFAGQKMHAIAGIGNPQRFFTTLDTLNVTHQDTIFADHHAFVSTDLQLGNSFSKQLVMTEKDWVKCAAFADENMWYLEINASLNAVLTEKLLKDLTALAKGE
jgi:tetraacyldisaccharide 4'-kinase